MSLRNLLISAVVLVFAGIPSVVRGVDTCVCDLSVSGSICTINQSATFNVGDNLSIQNLLDTADLSNCTAAFTASSFLDTAQTIVVSEANCSSLNASGTQTIPFAGDHQYNIACSYKGSGATAEKKKSKECTPPDCTPLQNPLGDVKNIPQIFGMAIKAVTGIMGSIALLAFIYGGVMWIMSGGNAERIKKGSQSMIWAVVGLVVIFSSYAIITLVIEGMGAL